jgi:hypothetical protein
MIMADGSVRWVSDKIDDAVVKDLARVKGRKVEINLEKLAPKLPPPKESELKTIASSGSQPSKAEPKSNPAPAVDRQLVTNHLKMLGLAYHSFLDAKRVPPASLDELAPFFENDAKLLEALRRGDYIFIYKVHILKMTAGTSNTILAYEKDVPSKGGLVLMADGSVQTMTAQEFQAAPKAQPS